MDCLFDGLKVLPWRIYKQNMDHFGLPPYYLFLTPVQVCESHSVVSDFVTPWTVLQARILEWVTFAFSRGSSQSRDQTQISHIAGGFLTIWVIREASIGILSYPVMYFLVFSFVFLMVKFYFLKTMRFQRKSCYTLCQNFLWTQLSFRNFLNLIMKWESFKWHKMKCLLQIVYIVFNAYA